MTFDPRTGLTPANALFMANACKAAYSGDPAAIEAAIGYKPTASLAVGDLFAYLLDICCPTPCSVLAFRGTVTVGGWLTDLDARQASVAGWAGKVHEGFAQAMSQFRFWMTNHVARTKPLWLTGHSLGGALATLASTSFDNIAEVYTFGSPRVGDKEFAAAFRPTHYRFVNALDIVPHVQPALEYEHVGELKMIGVRTIVAQVVQSIRDFRSRSYGQAFMQALRDHDIDSYIGSLAP
jgi:hypothetical protein